MKKEKLFHRDFLLVVIGQIISLFGNAILRFALPLHLLRVTGSPALFGLVTACSFLPMVVLSLLGGVLADRVNKRNIMVGLDFATAVLITIFYIFLGKLPIVPLFIVVLMILYGISGTYQPAVQASIPLLVKDDNMLRANAVINQISSISGLLGPIIGGMLFGAWGIHFILLVSIVCFALSAIMEIFIHIPFQKRADNYGMLNLVKNDLRESLHFIWKDNPLFIRLIVIVGLYNLILVAMMIVGIPVLIIENLGMSDSQLGIAQSVLALGGLFGGFLAAVLGSKLKIRHAHVLLFSCAVFVGLIGIIFLLVESAFVGYLGIASMSFCLMAASTMFTIQVMTMVQIQTPPELLGKVFACLTAFVMCAQPIGQALYGLLFDYFRQTPEVVLLTAAILSGFLFIYSKGIFRKLYVKHEEFLNKE